MRIPLYRYGLLAKSESSNFPAVIYDSATVTGDPTRYIYSWNEVRKSEEGYGSPPYIKWESMPNGRHGYKTDDTAARNMAEIIDAYSRDPVPDWTVVMMHMIPFGTAYEYWFSYEASGGAGISSFFARITGNSLVPNEDKRWRYGFMEVKFSGTGYGGWVNGSTDGTAYNMAEEPGAAYRIRPVKPNTVVEMFKLGDCYWFSWDANMDLLRPDSGTSFPIATLISMQGQLDSDSWDMTEPANYGTGVRVSVLTDVVYSTTTHQLSYTCRHLYFDPSGHLYRIDPEMGWTLITEAAECP